MSDKIKIAIDAMGGDGSPKKIIDGIIDNHKLHQENFFKIFGDKNQILKHIEGKIKKNFYEIVHTENIVKVLIALWKQQKEVKIQVCGYQLKV